MHLVKLDKLKMFWNASGKAGQTEYALENTYYRRMKDS